MKFKKLDNKFVVWLNITLLFLMIIPFLVLIFYKDSAFLQGFASLTMGIFFIIVFFFISNLKLPKIKRWIDIGYFALVAILIIIIYNIYSYLIWINFSSLLQTKNDSFNLKILSNISILLIFFYRVLLYIKIPVSKTMGLLNKEFRKFKPESRQLPLTSIKYLSSSYGIESFLKEFARILFEFIIITIFISMGMFLIVPIAGLETINAQISVFSLVLLSLEIWLWLGLVQIKFWR